MAFAGFTKLELKVIALRVNGVKGSEIAEQLGIARQLVYDAIWQACKKAGIKNDVALLTRWAMEWGFDEPLSPEPLETRPTQGSPSQAANQITDSTSREEPRQVSPEMKMNDTGPSSDLT